MSTDPAPHHCPRCGAPLARERGAARGLTQVDGHLEDAAGRVLATPTEESFFEALGLPWIDPTRRTA